MVAKVGFHRGVHWLAFAGAALLLLALARNRRQEIGSVIAVFLLGLSLEYLQHLIYGKAMEWWDVRDDTVAVSSGPRALPTYQGTQHCCHAAWLRKGMLQVH